MTSELKPCAHCGSPARYGEGSGDSEGGMFVECTNRECATTTNLVYPLMDDVRDVLREKWNRRAPSEAVGLLREVVALWDSDTFDIPIGDMDKTVDKIRRFLAAQEGT